MKFNSLLRLLLRKGDPAVRELKISVTRQPLILPALTVAQNFQHVIFSNCDL